MHGVQLWRIQPDSTICGGTAQQAAAVIRAWYTGAEVPPEQEHPHRTTPIACMITIYRIGHPAGGFA